MQTTATAARDLSLNALLPLLGWRSEPRTEGSRGKRIFDATGAFVGQLSATETWDLLVERGLVQS